MMAEISVDRVFASFDVDSLVVSVSNHTPRIVISMLAYDANRAPPGTSVDVTMRKFIGCINDTAYRIVDIMKFLAYATQFIPAEEYAAIFTVGRYGSYFIVLTQNAAAAYGWNVEPAGGSIRIVGAEDQEENIRRYLAATTEGLDGAEPQAEYYTTRFRAINAIYKSLVDEFENVFVPSGETDPSAWIRSQRVGFYNHVLTL